MNWVRMCTAAAVLAALATAQTPQSSRDRRAIAAAKSIPVSQLDRKLPRIAFDQWLRTQVPNGRITYEVNDCGEQTGNPQLDRGRDFPMCAEARISLGARHKLYIELPVGTFKTGVKAGPAGFFYAVIVGSDGSQNWIKTLSKVPEAIKAIKIGDMPAPGLFHAELLAGVQHVDGFTQTLPRIRRGVEKYCIIFQ